MESTSEFYLTILNYLHTIFPSTSKNRRKINIKKTTLNYKTKVKRSPKIAKQRVTLLTLGVRSAGTESAVTFTQVHTTNSTKSLCIPNSTLQEREPDHWIYLRTTPAQCNLHTPVNCLNKLLATTLLSTLQL